MAAVDADIGFNLWAIVEAHLWVPLYASLYPLNVLRHSIYAWLQFGSAVVLLVIEYLQLDLDYYQTRKSVFAQEAFMVVWNLVCGSVIGPTSTVIMGEASSSALPAKTVAVASVV